uniref:Transmembrane protein 18 n=1 Tax=Alexandrium catenella TaxID=2925 RepID=A0A7S1S490_ALECA|eukprot:UN2815
MAAERPPGSTDLPPLDDMLHSLLHGKHAYTNGFWEDMQAFVHAIDWQNDRWLFGVFSFEALAFVLVIANRRHWERLAVLFMAIGALLFFAERINGIARVHWKEFASQQYFDESGAFFSAILGMPLVVCQFLIVILLLREAATMVIKVKRLELRKDMASKAKQQ